MSHLAAVRSRRSVHPHSWSVGPGRTGTVSQARLVTVTRVPTGDEEPSTSGSGPLTDVEVAVLSFAHQRWKYPGAMETRILEEFGWSLTRYHQVLNALIDRPEALEFDSTLVARLRRLRSTRQQARSANRTRL